MRLLSRYLLRQLVAPFCFSLAALTSLMLLNQIAKKFGSLVGKGLPWSVVAEVFVLSLPFILAMTLPMAVLLAVLYAFSHLAADNEVTALRASGISVPQMLRPVFGWGVVMAVLTFGFVDQVLPRSNARLRGLLIDIGRKRPTFELREQVINEVPPSKYFLRAGRIDPSTGRLRNVTIYDVNDEKTRRVIYADSGVMAYAPGGRDLSLLLFHGTVHQYKADEADRFQVTRFDQNDIRVRNVFDELERNTSDNIRGDREMSTCEMLDVVRDADHEKVVAERDRRQLLRRDLRELLALPPAAADTVAPETVPPDYCVWVERARARLFPPAVATQTPPRRPPATPLPVAPPPKPAAPPPAGAPAPMKTAAPAPAGAPQPAPSVLARAAPTDSTKRAASATQPTTGRPTPPHPAPKPTAPLPASVAKASPAGKGRPAPIPRAPSPAAAALAVTPPPAAHDTAPPRLPPRLSAWPDVTLTTDRWKDADLRSDRYMVEVHKKWAIATACLPFVLLGIALALRFPRGGMGLVIGGGLAAFSIYYVGLTAGEALADRGLLSPLLAMWLPNMILTAVGVIGLARVNRQPGLNRGGDFRELFDAIRWRLRRRRREKSPVPAPSAQASA